MRVGVAGAGVIAALIVAGTASAGAAQTYQAPAQGAPVALPYCPPPPDAYGNPVAAQPGVNCVAPAGAYAPPPAVVQQVATEDEPDKKRWKKPRCRIGSTPCR